MVFQSWDRGQYSSFGCIDCHGLRRVPPPEFLPELEWANGHFLAFDEQPEVAHFMREKVVPAMQAAMGAEFSNRETTTEQLGCSGCHQVKRR